MADAARPVRAWPILVGAALLLSLAMGIRQSFGLFMQPMAASGITVADFTFSIAVQNVVWGLSQPFIGALADRVGFRRVAVGGALLYAASIMCSVVADHALWLILGTGPLLGVALSCTAATLNMAAAARTASEAKRSMILGIVSAGGSLGTLVTAPVAQGLMDVPAGWLGGMEGWRVAMLALFGMALVMVPAAMMMGQADKIPLPPRRNEPTSFRAVVGEALRRRAFLVMAGAYMVCGLQLVFLTTHLPTYLAMCGMDPMLSAQSLAVIGGFNIAGAYMWGWLGGIYPKHVMLGLLYILRSIALAVFFMFPPSPVTTLAFAAVMGLLWMGVSPLSSGLIAQMFGLRYMATILSLAFFSHQLGSFLGAWGGGIILESLGSYDRAWQTGVLIGLIAGTVQIAFGADSRPRPQLRPAVA
jgi:MFS family permease